MIRRTPTKPTTRTGGRASSLDEGAGSSGVTGAPGAPGQGGVRKSIGEWEAGRKKSPSPLQKTFTVDPPSQQTSAAGSGDSQVLVSDDSTDSTAVTMAKQRPRLALGCRAASPSADVGAEAATSPPKSFRYADRVAEAKVCLIRVKTSLGRSGNIKREIKTDVQAAADRLYQLVKEAASVKGGMKEHGEKERSGKSKHTTAENQADPVLASETSEGTKELLLELQEHKRALDCSRKQMLELNDQIVKASESIAASMSKVTYAQVTSGPAIPTVSERQPLHSIVVSSSEVEHTSGMVMDRVRTAIDARSNGIQIERIKKARDQKVIIGCHSKEHLARVAENIKKSGGNLMVEEVRNKDPQIILKDVLSYNTDEDIKMSLKTQNRHLIGDICSEEQRLTIKYRRKTRNEHTCHVVMQVSPMVWQRLTTAGKVHIDIQRVVVLDQSPLIQCTRCLGYGHGRRYCKEEVDLCSHCGGPHLKTECPEWLVGGEPSCRNCTKAKFEGCSHNSFDAVCPIRKRWEAIARSSVAYC